MNLANFTTRFKNASHNFVVYNPAWISPVSWLKGWQVSRSPWGVEELEARGVYSSLSPPGGRGKFIKCVGEEFQVVKRRREYHGCGEEYNLEKMERGSNSVLSIILMLLGKILSGEEGMRTEIQGKKIKIRKYGGYWRNFIHPC